MNGNGATIAIVVVSAVAAIGTGVYFLYKHISKKRKSKEDAFQSIEIENVGTCKNCNEPLSGSEYVFVKVHKGKLSEENRDALGDLLDRRAAAISNVLGVKVSSVVDHKKK